MLNGFGDVVMQLANPMSWVVAGGALFVALVIGTMLCMMLVLIEKFTGKNPRFLWGLLVLVVGPVLFWLAGVLGWAFAFLITG